MLESLKLPCYFDPARLQADLALIEAEDWLPHFNTREYEGDWSVAPLRSIDGKARQIYPDPTAGADRFADTPLLERCGYFREVLRAFPCPHQAVRLLRLAAGSRIREHRDFQLGFQDGEVRIHIPVVTSPLVEFYVSGKRVVMNEGEAWYIDFNQPHRIDNLGSTDRIHLVIDCVVNDWFRSLFHSLNFEQFHQFVLADPALQARLREAAALEPLPPLLIQAGEEHGFSFGTEEVNGAMNMARRSWIERWVP